MYRWVAEDERAANWNKWFYDEYSLDTIAQCIQDQRKLFEESIRQDKAHYRKIGMPIPELPVCESTCVGIPGFYEDYGLCGKCYNLRNDFSTWFIRYLDRNFKK